MLGVGLRADIKGMRSLSVAALALMMAACSPAPDAKVAIGTMDQARVEVARSQEIQYRNAEASGSAVDRCERATQVAQAWQQAGNAAEYARWKATETTDCMAAR